MEYRQNQDLIDVPNSDLGCWDDNFIPRCEECTCLDSENCINLHIRDQYTGDVFRDHEKDSLWCEDLDEQWKKQYYEALEEKQLSEAYALLRESIDTM